MLFRHLPGRASNRPHPLARRGAQPPPPPARAPRLLPAPSAARAPSSPPGSDDDEPVGGDPTVQDGLAAMLRLQIGAEEVKELVAREEEKLIASAEKVSGDDE